MEIGGGGGGNGEMGMPSNREALDPLYHQRRKLPPRSDQAPAVGSESEAAPVVAPSVRYRECQKNHAAAKGGHVVDGCGEFMPCGDDGSPDSLKCAACECHRNFHRKEVDGHSHFAAAAHHNYNYNPAATITITPPAPGPIFPGRLGSHHQVVAPVMMAFGGAAESSSEDLQRKQAASGSRKRFRTKFSQEQKEKMMGFAEKVGWKIQKQDDKQVHQFCDELGLKRQVLKVWMHNNKPNTNKNNQPL